MFLNDIKQNKLQHKDGQVTITTGAQCFSLAPSISGMTNLDS